MRVWSITLALLLQLILAPAFAQDEESEDEVRYIDLTPPFVTNYGGPGRMRYIKAEVSIRVDSQEAYRAVLHHVPSLRHVIVMLLSKQTDESIGSAEGKEALRVEALTALQEVMQVEEEDKMIEDLLFSSFFVQR